VYDSIGNTRPPPPKQVLYHREITILSINFKVRDRPMKKKLLWGGPGFANLVILLYHPSIRGSVNYFDLFYFTICEGVRRDSSKRFVGWKAASPRNTRAGHGTQKEHDGIRTCVCHPWPLKEKHNHRDE
jgi:hypothetical protein